MQTGSEQVHEPVAPPRWRSVVWGTRVVLGVLVVLVGVRLCWGWYAERKLAAALQACRDRGEAVSLEDVAGPPIPDEENAAPLIIEAARQRDRLEAAESLSMDYLPTDAESYRVRNVVAAGATKLELLWQARRMGKVRWPTWDPAPGRESPGWYFSLLNSTREVNYLLRAAALEARRSGDHAAVVERLRDHLHFVEAVDEQQTLQAHLVILSSLGHIDRSVVLLAPDLNPGRDPEISRNVRTMIDRLLDEEAWRRRAVGALHTARSVDEFNAYLRAKSGAQFDWRSLAGTPYMHWTEEAFASLFRPATTLRWAREVERLTELAAQISQPMLPAPAGPGTMRQPVGGTGVFLADVVVRWPIGTESRSIIEYERRAMLRRRGMALRLAIRLYELDHGDVPPSLEALVPKYIPAVPSDPFARTLRPMGYVPSLKGGVYSVGENGVDDIANGWAPVDWTRQWNSLNSADWLVPLERPRPNPPAPARPPRLRQAR